MVAPCNDLCERSFVRWRHHPKADATRALAASTVRVLTMLRLLQLSVDVFQINNIVHYFFNRWMNMNNLLRALSRLSQMKSDFEVKKIRLKVTTK